MKKIALIGSIIQERVARIIAEDFEREGYEVLVTYPSTCSGHNNVDQVHAETLKHISESDTAYVINVNDYISPLMKEEMDYARDHMKAIMYLEPSRDEWRNDIFNRIVSNRPTIYTLCGSMKFKKRIDDVRTMLEFEGNIVFTPVLRHPAGYRKLSAERIQQLRELHDRKIELADVVYIVCPDGYYGDDTKREIDYAINLGKTIMYDDRPL